VSEENLELGARLAAALNAREISDELADELFAPGFRMVNTATALSDSTYYGAPGVREWIRDHFEPFDEHTIFLIEEILADSEDYVVARMALAGHGGRSGAPLTLRWTAVLWCKGGKITHTTGYSHRRDALKAVGLEK
jgi:hypothetical protein